MKKNFLIEIGTEELPQKMVRLLGESFHKNFKKQLKIKKLKYSCINWYATSRRLAIKINDLVLNKKKIYIIKKENSKFKLKNNEKKKDNKKIITKVKNYIIEKTNYFIFNKITNKNIQNKILIKLILKCIKKLPIIKFMRFGENEIKFIRPVRSIIILFGEKLITGKIFNVNSKKIIYGHQFMGKKKIFIKSAKQYPDVLFKKGKVIADYEIRKTILKKKIIKIAKKINGIIKLKNYILEELTSLVEWPIVLHGKFNKKFLKLPNKVLLYIIEKKQKYIAVYNAENQLINNFIFISNIQTNKKNKIIFWNEKIIHSILTDAEYFYKIDKKKKLEQYLLNLKKVLFQNSLGNLYEKSKRLQKLSNWIAIQIKANPIQSSRAALLSKCDLATNLVFEFSGTQGDVGMHYALINGEEKNVAIAIKEQYKPNFPNEKIASNIISNVLALADRFDNLVGIIGINKKPNGSQDPFGLRRITNGILRIIIEKKYDLDLNILIEKSIELYNKKLINPKTSQEVLNFILNRLLKFYQNLGYKKNIIQSALIYKTINLIDLDKRIKSINNFSNLKESKILIAINKRISNILKKSKKEIKNNFSTEILKTKEEKDLTIHFFYLKKKIKKLLKNKEYEKALIECSNLNQKINLFFKKVFIFDKNLKIQLNRLILLKNIKNIFLKIANVSLLD